MPNAVLRGGPLDGEQRHAETRAPIGIGVADIVLAHVLPEARNVTRHGIRPSGAAEGVTDAHLKIQT
ncbi:hypothetical protein [Actinospica robiniae]|uniref:hypothetical protein n=1 Tax=Actinospica robiniae TaxID=304901 RepID=UPI000413F3AB|nr:hypothetical protein [Actinospica robiniae]